MRPEAASVCGLKRLVYEALRYAEGTSASGDFGRGWAIEFDGPSHFLACACKAPTGATLIKRRHLQLIGYILVCVPYWEWDELSGMDERRTYLEGKLQFNVVV